MAIPGLDVYRPIKRYLYLCEHRNLASLDRRGSSCKITTSTRKRSVAMYHSGAGFIDTITQITIAKLLHDSWLNNTMTAL